MPQKNKAGRCQSKVPPASSCGWARRGCRKRGAERGRAVPRAPFMGGVFSPDVRQVSGAGEKLAPDQITFSRSSKIGPGTQVPRPRTGDTEAPRHGWIPLQPIPCTEDRTAHQESGHSVTCGRAVNAKSPLVCTQWSGRV